MRKAWCVIGLCMIVVVLMSMSIACKDSGSGGYWATATYGASELHKMETAEAQP